MSILRPLVFAVSLFFASVVQARDTIAVIHSYPPGEWFHGIQQSLDKSSRELGMDLHFEPIVFHAEYWLRRSTGEMEAERERVMDKIRTMSAVAVVVCDDEASDVFALSLSRRQHPVFFSGINRRLADLPWWNDVRPTSAIVLEEYPVEQLLRSARRLIPQSKRIRLVSSKNPSSHIIVDRIRSEWRPLPEKAPFELAEIFQSDSWQEWKTYLSEFGKNPNAKSDLIWILVPYDVRDVHGVEVPLERIGRWMSEELRAPSLGLSSVHPKMGVLLTVALSPRQLASATVAQIHSWRKGTPIAKLSPKVEGQGQLHLNLATAKKLGLRIPEEVFAVSKIVTESGLPYGR